MLDLHSAMSSEISFPPSIVGFVAATTTEWYSSSPVAYVITIGVLLSAASLAGEFPANVGSWCDWRRVCWSNCEQIQETWGQREQGRQHLRMKAHLQRGV